MKKLINSFIEKYGTLNTNPHVPKSYEDDEQRRIEWESKIYFVPKYDPNWTEDEQLIYEFLRECYQI